MFPLKSCLFYICAKHVENVHLTSAKRNVGQFRARECTTHYPI